MDQARSENRTRLLRLELGMDRATVLQTMGTTPVRVRDGTTVTDTINNPYRSEMYRANDHVFEIVYYYTDRKAADNAITDDELTPLVLKDGVLDGWGWSYLKDTAAKYEVRLR